LVYIQRQQMSWSCENCCLFTEVGVKSDITVSKLGNKSFSMMVHTRIYAVLFKYSWNVWNSY